MSHTVRTRVPCPESTYNRDTDRERINKDYNLHLSDEEHLSITPVPRSGPKSARLRRPSIYRRRRRLRHGSGVDVRIEPAHRHRVCPPLPSPPLSPSSSSKGVRWSTIWATRPHSWVHPHHHFRCHCYWCWWWYSTGCCLRWRRNFAWVTARGRQGCGTSSALPRLSPPGRFRGLPARQRRSRGDSVG